MNDEQDVGITDANPTARRQRPTPFQQWPLPPEPPTGNPPATQPNTPPEPTGRTFQDILRDKQWSNEMLAYGDPCDFEREWERREYEESRYEWQPLRPVTTAAPDIDFGGHTVRVTVVDSQMTLDVNDFWRACGVQHPENGFPTMNPAHQ